MGRTLTTLMLSLPFKELVERKLRKFGIDYIRRNPMNLTWQKHLRRIFQPNFLGLKSSPNMIWFQLLKDRVLSFIRFGEDMDSVSFSHYGLVYSGSYVLINHSGILFHCIFSFRFTHENLIALLGYLLKMAVVSI